MTVEFNAMFREIARDICDNTIDVDENCTQVQVYISYEHFTRLQQFIQDYDKIVAGQVAVALQDKQLQIPAVCPRCGSSSNTSLVHTLNADQSRHIISEEYRCTFAGCRTSFKRHWMFSGTSIIE